MWFTRVSIHNPVFATMMMAAILVLGLLSYQKLRVDEFPDINFPVVVIETEYPGASAETVENDISIKIEESLNALSGLNKLHSSSYQGRSLVIAEFKLNVDAASAIQDVREKIAQVKVGFRREIKEPRITRYDLADAPIISYAISANANFDQRQLTTYADQVIKKRLESIEGVGSVALLGGAKRQINIYLKPAQLEAWAIGVDQIQSVLRGENQELPTGVLRAFDSERLVSLQGRVKKVEDFKKIIVARRGSNPSQAVTLAQVADVVDSTEESERVALLDGQAIVAMNVLKTRDGNTIDIVERLEKALQSLRQELPPGVEIKVIRDASLPIRVNVRNVQETLLEGAVLTILIVFLFLNSWRSTVITGLTLPIALIGSFLLMYALGFTINLLTLMALSLCVGLLIDDAIVVRENIIRHIAMGKSYQLAALEGTKEIGLAVFATTMSIVAVFLPIAFMEGIIGRFFYQFGLTIVAAVILSMFVSFTLDPMLSAFWPDPADRRRRSKNVANSSSMYLEAPDLLQNRSERASVGGGRSAGTGVYGVIHEDSEHRPTPNHVRVVGFARGLMMPELPGVDRRQPETARALQLRRLFGVFNRFTASLSDAYQVLLAWSLKHRLKTLLMTGAILFSSFLLLPLIGTEFVPQAQFPESQIFFETPVGSSLDFTTRKAKQVDAILREFPDVLSTYITINASNQGTNQAYVYLRLKDRQQRHLSIPELQQAMRLRLAKLPGVNVTNVSAINTINNGQKMLEISLQGPDSHELERLAILAQQRMRDIANLVDLESSQKSEQPILAVDIHRELASDLGISLEKIANVLRVLLAGDEINQWLGPDDKNYDVNLRLAPADRTNSDALKRLMLTSTIVDAEQLPKMIPLHQVVELRPATSITQIQRRNLNRQVTISANTFGRSSGEVLNDMRKVLESLDFKPGYRFVVVGAANDMQESFDYALMALALAVILIYMILAAQFKSFLQPIALMVSLPLTLIGVFGALLIFNSTLNIFSIIGFVMLMGLVTKNAILLIDFVNQARQGLHAQALERSAAILAAARVRLRPILMTTLAMIFGMLPLAFSWSEGSENRAPMGQAVIGGVIASSFLTLIVVPVIYTYLDDFAEFLRNKWQKKPIQRPIAGAE